jgi:hypothetical protein
MSTNSKALAIVLAWHSLAIVARAQEPATSAKESHPAPVLGVEIPDEPNAFSGVSPPPAPKWWQLPALNGPGRVWASADYLYWWIKDGPVPGPLVTSGTTDSQGVLGNAGTVVLLGDKGLDYGPLSGGRFTFGFCNEDRSWSVEAVALVLETGQFGFATGTAPVLARPFVNALSGQETVSLVSLPGAFAGAIQVGSSTDLAGVEVNLIHNVSHGFGAAVNLIAGFRYLQLDEDLAISNTSTILPGGTVGFNGETITGAGSFSLSDDFKTRNQFYGGQAGAELSYQYCGFFLQFAGKMGVGNTHETVQANGQTTATDAGGTSRTTAGGLFAVPGNIGLASRNAFTLVPEGSFTFGVDLSQNIHLYAGYSVLYWEDILRPGNVINRSVNTSSVPTSLTFGTGAGTVAPLSTSHRSDFWAQGLNVGVAFQY